TLEGGDRKHIFAVTNPGVRICSLRMDGASAISERDLVSLASDALAGRYSRSYLTDFSRQTMTQPYRRAGYWRATFGPPQTTIGGVPGCDGVVVTMRVDEGVSYTWDHAVWTGNAAMTASQLDALLGFKSGEVANGTKLGDGLRAVKVAHGKMGYLDE